MSKRIRGIIFDLDGVICHTDQYHYKAWKQLADKIGVYFDQKINNRLRGVSRMDSLDIILENYNGDFSEEEKKELANYKNDIYRNLLQKMTPEDLSTEVKSTLENLKDTGLKLAIGSSSKNAKLILERIGLGDFFDAVSDGNNISKSKPDPEVFLKAAAFLNLPPENCIVVEDAFAGVEAANAGGFISVAIGDATTCEKANYRIYNFSEIENIVVSVNSK